MTAPKCGIHVGTELAKQGRVKLGRLIGLAAAVLLFADMSAAQTPRKYHRLTIAQMTSENPAKWSRMRTHVEIEGYLTYKAKEEDRDWHLRLCTSASVQGMNRKLCIVSEAIPTMPEIWGQAAKLKTGAHIRISGISRFDAQRPGHNWWEVHPVEQLEVLPWRHLDAGSTSGRRWWRSRRARRGSSSRATSRTRMGGRSATAGSSTSARFPIATALRWPKRTESTGARRASAESAAQILRGRTTPCDTITAAIPA